MEEASLRSADFWQSDSSHVMYNTRLPQSEKTRVSEDVVRRLKGHLFFQTSGTSGNQKWVALSKHAMLASAKAVNDHLSIRSGESWCIALPTFHVGGMSLFARTYHNGGEVISLEGQWDAGRFVSQLGHAKVNWVSLVPAQVSDIVQAGLECPDSLRGCIVGGGALSVSALENAEQLGWPIHESYGMTEAASQIATAKLPGGELEILPHVECKLTSEQKLLWRGSSMMSGYIINDVFQPVSDWIETNDKVQLDKQILRFVGRSDRMVKILGELVDLDALEQKINVFSDQKVVLVTKPDERRGLLLVPIVECPISQALEAQLRSFRGIEALARPVQKSFPRSALGKVMRGELLRLFLDTIEP